MSALYYFLCFYSFLGLIVFWYELSKIINLKFAYKFSTEENAGFKEVSEQDFLFYYVLWCIVGLFTPQRIFFATILLMAVVQNIIYRKKSVPEWYIKLDSIISIFLILWIIINQIYFHIKF